MKNSIPANLFCFFAALALLSAVPRFAQKITVQLQPVERSVIEQRLRAVGGNNLKREQTLKNLFQEVGCRDDRLTEQPIKHWPVPNLICTQLGTTDSLIIIGGHMDFVARGKGVVDDWSGASLLASLFESLHVKPPKHTFIFIGFASEEDGLVGSKSYVKQLTPEQASKIRAMVNLECLGLTPTKVWAHHADPKLLQGIASVAAAIHSPIQAVNVENVGDDDADSFRSREIPTITIHSVTQETFPVLHSGRDDFSAIHLDDYYESYRLVDAFLAYLDEALD